ncbi:hypothetical protein F0L74_11735 [Chitinophaga agrisoli]|uniref:Uncharacterized protein n=1 Tax=Chitinophaga agrisoli TaxID=2607653 RepID=A0A5B2VYV9_9BACT|nr:hypothetical protein [Chitinophaga agrisoli]KAA2243179.1 hypothetical protein F0L74_11735 [Chitinophaga agrisoli]
MPEMNCRFGNIIPMGEIPNPNEWLFISDVEYDKFFDTIDAEVLYMQMKGMLKCDQCGRLWFFWNGYDKEPICYIQE